VDPNREQSESLNRSRFNSLTSLSILSGKPLSKSLSLFFFRKGSNRPTVHGLPTLIQLSKVDRIPDWQQYLQQQIQEHPAWKSYPNIKSFEIDPDKPICVGFWEGGNTLPNANELTGSGIIADLLRLVENPKSGSGSTNMSSVSRGGRKTTESIKMAYTVHIRTIGDCSDEESEADLASHSSLEDILTDIHLPSKSSTTHQRTSSSNKQSHFSHSTLRSQNSISSLINSSHHGLPSTHTPIVETLLSDIPIQETTTKVVLEISDHESDSPSSSTLHQPNSLSLSSRPSTPKNRSSLIGRKRSLTLLSPQNISTQSTQELKKPRSIHELSKFSSTRSKQGVAFLNTHSDDDGESTELDDPDS